MQFRTMLDSLLRSAARGTAWRRGTRAAMGAALAVSAALAAACTGGRPTPVPSPTPVAALQPNHYQSPLVRLQHLETDTTMLEVQEVRYRASDKRLFACTDLHGFEVIDAKDPANMSYEANYVSPESIAKDSPFGKNPPGCVHLGWDGDIVYFTHRGNESNPTYLAAYDISKKPPEQVALRQEPDLSFEGVDVSDGNIYVGLHDKGLGVYRRDGGTITKIATATGLTNAWGVFAQGKTVFVADGQGGLATVDVSDPTAPKVIGAVATGGHARSVVVDGTTAYVGAAAAGLVIVDVADPAAPKVIGRAETPGSASQVAYADGRVYVGAWTDARAYDVSQPAAPRLLASVRFDTQSRWGAKDKGAGDLDEGRPMVPSRTFAVAAAGDIVFVGNWHQLYSYRLYPDRVAPSLVVPDSATWLDFGKVAPGTPATVTLALGNQGNAPLNAYDIWAEGDGFAVLPEQVHIEPSATAQVTMTFTPSGPDQVVGRLHIRSDDPAAPERTAGLVGNRPGLAVGDTLPETRVALLGGGHWLSSEPAAAGQKVRLLAYFATF